MIDNFQFAQLVTTLSTNSISASKNKDFVNLYTKEGEEIDKIKSYFSKESLKELEVYVPIQTRIRFDLNGIEKNIISCKRGLLEEVKEKLERFKISMTLSNKDIYFKLKDYIPNLKSMFDYNSLKASQHDCAKLWLEKLRLEKEISDYENLVKFTDSDGFVSPQYNYYGSLSGRIISHSPSIQSIPKSFKDFLLPLKEEDLLFELDITCAEPIALAFLTNETKVFDLLENNKTIYRYVVEEVFKLNNEKFTDVHKQMMKRIVNGIFYGMGSSSIEAELKKVTNKNIKRGLGENIKEKILNLFPNIKSYLIEIEKAKVLTTEYGHSFNVSPSYKNLYFPAQNLIATLLKEILKDLSDNKLLGNIINLVHDSIWVSCSKEDKDRIIKIFKRRVQTLLHEDYQDKGIDLVKIKHIGGVSNEFAEL